MSTILSAIAPRLLLVVGWYNDPTYWNGVFASPVWLLGGFLFFPMTAFMYGLVQANGMTLLNWIFVAAALAVDLGTWGIGIFAGRKEYQAYRGT